jgi:PKD repeat protein
MIGVAFNPSNCVFLENQALNSNQFANPSAPDSANTTVHTILWDFVAQKIYWVDAKTNIIQHEIPGANAGNLFADISYEGVTVSGLEFKANPTGGTAPYTYLWSFESSPKNNWSFNGSSTNQSVFVIPADADPTKISMVKCKVTDAEGRIVSADHMIYDLAYIIP